MHLTKYTDYAFRTLIFLGLQKPAELVTIGDVAERFSIPRNHLVKIVNHLAREGFIETLRGKGGGMRLARPATQINLRDVVEATEETLVPIDCNQAQCCIRTDCRLRGVMGEAQEAFLAVFARYSLCDLLQAPDRLEQLLGWHDQAPASLAD